MLLLAEHMLIGEEVELDSAVDPVIAVVVDVVGVDIETLKRPLDVPFLVPKTVPGLLDGVLARLLYN